MDYFITLVKCLSSYLLDINFYHNFTVIDYKGLDHFKKI